MTPVRKDVPPGNTQGTRSSRTRVTKTQSKIVNEKILHLKHLLHSEI